MLLSSSLVNDVRELTGPFTSTKLPLFANVPYLRRFRLHRFGTIFITLFVGSRSINFPLSYNLNLNRDYLPESPQTLIASFLDNRFHHFSVDSMTIDWDKVLWLSVKYLDGLFNVTGHYPILAGYGPDGAALYVAAVEVDIAHHFTFVEDGARIARYTDEIGDTYETGRIFRPRSAPRPV